MTNSDLVMLNQYFYTLRDDLFTPHRQVMFLKSQKAELDKLRLHP